MKFTVERRALVKMLEVVGRKDPSKKWRDKEVRLSACAARVFVEANESTAGIEALVIEDGTCSLEHKTFLNLLKMHSPKKNVTIEADEHKITFATTTLPVRRFSSAVMQPAEFQRFPVTDGWLSGGDPQTGQTQRAELRTQLPNAEKAIVEREKTVDYLLNQDHPIGGSKARYFIRFGFSVDKWEQLADALRIHGQTHEVKRTSETGFGPRYEVEGPLDTPDGRAPLICSVWQFDDGAIAPRLITAYPLKAR